MTLTKLEERIVERRGLLLIPGTWDRLGSLVLTADLVVVPEINFLNNNYQPARKRYSNITFLGQDRVMADLTQSYAYQEFTLLEPSLAQTVSLAHCAEQNLLLQIAALGAGSVPPIPTNTISSVIAGGGIFPRHRGDYLLFRTLDDARIKFTLWAVGGYECVTSPIPTFVPDLEAIPNPVPFDDPNKNTLFPVSAPYNPPDDNGFTYVPPPPTPPGLPAGSDCQQVEIVWRVNTSGAPINGTDLLFGPVTDFYLNPAPPISPFATYQVLADCRGRVGAMACQPPGTFAVQSGQVPDTINSIEILGVTPL